MKHFQQSLRETIDEIKKRKWFFIFLIMVQLLFVFLLSYVTLTYNVKIFHDVERIMGPLQNANLDLEGIEAGQPFLKELDQVYQSYNSMTRNIALLGLWIVLLFLVGNGFLWICTHQMLHDEVRAEPKLSRNKLHFLREKFLSPWIKYVVSSVSGFVIFASVSYLAFRIVVATSEITPAMFLKVAKISLLLFFVIYYFLLVSYSFIQERTWKRFRQLFFLASVKKIASTISILIMTDLVLVLSGGLVYLTIRIEQLSLLILITTVLFMAALVVTRMFWIASLKNITLEK